MYRMIVDSKLYKTSERKKKIISNLENSDFGVGLVQQPTESLSDKYRKMKLEEYEKRESERHEKEQDDGMSDNGDAVDTEERSEDSVRTPSSSGGGSSHGSGSYISSEPDEALDFSPSEEGSSESESGSGDIEESEDITKVNMQDVVDNLKVFLNSREDTGNVNRVMVKDDKEVWIYYNDSVNLNDIMGNVIELLNASGYTYLEFNRLARSDNAVVFLILKNDTNVETKPLEQVDDIA